MTQLLTDALAALQKLPAQEQDAIAWIILAELEDEARWNRAFENSQVKLAKLAGQVRKEIAAGKVREGGFDNL